MPSFDTLAKTCVEHRGCDGGVRVGYCRYAGQGHGFWPSYGEQLTWWWLSQQTLGGGARTGGAQQRRAALKARLLAMHE